MVNEFEQLLIVYKESDKSYHFYRDVKHLGVCNYPAYKHGFYSDLIVYTMHGRSYKISRAKIRRYKVWPIFYWFLGSPIIELDFDFIPTASNLPFGSLKKKLTLFFRTDSYLENIDMKKATIQKVIDSKNFHELSNAIGFLRE